MRRPLLLLPLGLIAAALAFGAVYWFQTRAHRALQHAPAAELAWLRHEFRLTEAQFARVAELHTAYRPKCADLCRRISEQNDRLRQAALASRDLTPQLEELVAETGRARDECRRAMLTHLYAVAREMPPDEGRRYLSFMLEATCVLEEGHPIDALHAQHTP